MYERKHNYILMSKQSKMSFFVILTFSEYYFRSIAFSLFHETFFPFIFFFRFLEV